ncbi:MAG TPA: SRPBCC family protein [Thermoanaerobaculia bacterium]|nr:SRPBCC family protein [Thermoanaerobaculia bacterium]
MGSISITTGINAPVDVCFDAARDVALHMKSAAFSGERLIAPGRLEGLLELGDLVCFEGRHFGIGQTFCARITEVQRPDRFVDEMVRGAFRWMRHVHAFERDGHSTVMRDLVIWEAPLGILGRLADKIFLERHMHRFVETKQKQLKGLIEGRL